MSNEILVPLLAVVTIALAGAVAIWQRARVAKSKNDPERSSFTRQHGEAPRGNRPGTDH